MRTPKTKRVVMLLLIIWSTTLSVCAQKNKFALEYELGYSNQTKQATGTFNMQYGLSSALRMSLGFTGSPGKDNHTSLYGGHLDIHYLFPVSKKVAIYPICGLGYSYWKVEEKLIAVFIDELLGSIFDPERDSRKEEPSHQRIGLNLGGGIAFRLNKHFSIDCRVKQELINHYSFIHPSMSFAYHF